MVFACTIFTTFTTTTTTVGRFPHHHHQSNRQVIKKGDEWWMCMCVCYTRSHARVYNLRSLRVVCGDHTDNVWCVMGGASVCGV